MLAFLLVLPVMSFAEDDPVMEPEESLEEAVIIENEDSLEAYETPSGDVHYRSKFLGKEYCVRMRPADPLDSFDVGTTIVVPCGDDE